MCAFLGNKKNEDEDVRKTKEKRLLDDAEKQFERSAKKYLKLSKIDPKTVPGRTDLDLRKGLRTETSADSI